MFDPFSIIAAFAPIAIEAGKAAVNRWIAPDKIKPMSVAEAVQMEQSDIDRLRVLAELDKPGENVSWWVNDIRALMRPMVALMVTAAWVYSPDSAGITMAAQSVWFYLFGERTLRK
jgi:hypothetical protein